MPSSLRASSQSCGSSEEAWWSHGQRASLLQGDLTGSSIHVWKHILPLRSGLCRRRVTQVVGSGHPPEGQGSCLLAHTPDARSVLQALAVETALELRWKMPQALKMRRWSVKWLQVLALRSSATCPTRPDRMLSKTSQSRRIAYLSKR